MAYEFGFSIHNGTMADYVAENDIGIRFSCESYKGYLFVLYKNTVFLLDNEDNVIVNNGIKAYSDEYAYVRFYFEPVPDDLVNEFIDLLELMIQREHIKYAFIVSVKGNIDICEHIFLDRGYEEFYGIDPERLAETLGAHIIYDATYRKQVYSDKW